MIDDDSSPSFPRIVHRAFADFDEVAASFEGTQILRRTRGPYYEALISAELGPVALLWSSHSSPIIARAKVEPRRRMFLMRPDSDGTLLVNGHALDERRLVDQRPGTDMHLATRPGYRCLELVKILALPEELDRVSIALTGARFSSGPSLCTLLQPDARALSLLRRLCAGVLATIESPGGPANAASLAALAEAVLGAVVIAVNSDPGRKDGHEWTRDFQARLIQRADAFLGAHASERITLSRLCVGAGATERQLQRAFRAVYGISPNRYVKLRRLHLARGALLNANPGTTVAWLATRFGFQDLGRFASAYRGLFGEAPSLTLRRRDRDRHSWIHDLSRSTYPTWRETPITRGGATLDLGEGSDACATPPSDAPISPQAS
jgi:AraC-like DNA-binding protein